MVVIKTVSLLFAAAAFLVAGNGVASAQDTLKIAVPQRGAWDTSITEIGNRVGIFKKHGVNADLLFTGGGAEALGAIIGQSIDAAVSVGISTVLGSFSKGAPVRVFSAETTGQPDIYWFVPAQSPMSRPCARWEWPRALSPDICICRTAAATAMTAAETPTPGLRSICRGRAGSISIRQAGSSATAASSVSRWCAIHAMRYRCTAPGPVTPRTIWE